MKYVETMVLNFLNIMIKFERLGNPAKITVTNTANIEKNVNKIEENMNKIFEYLKKYPNAKHKDIMENLQISKRTLERMIALLKEKKYIERVGNNRLGYWNILK